MNYNNWYNIKNIDEIDTPALVIFTDRVKENINILKSFVADINNLRPHVKTHKSAEITKLLMAEGIYKFKCATIAEAEMLAMTGVKDVLLAYQPIGPKALRLADLVKKYHDTKFSCLIDNITSAKYLSEVFAIAKPIDVYIDLNVGMNRTGILPKDAAELYDDCKPLKGITVAGLHAYDGHIRDTDLALRTKNCNEAFAKVESLKHEIEKRSGNKLMIIAGGTPTFPIHAKRKNAECSPGTFIYWDKGYQSILAEQPFRFAALVVTRVISKPNNETICVDLGHKSIASENPLANRVLFLNAEDLQPIGHSEEHMVLKSDKENSYKVGDVLYGVPYHICPTVALHDETAIIENNTAVGKWDTVSRKRKITI
jgi:D-serine deaminase-like pyridoxal phosphate-dependent protein